MIESDGTLHLFASNPKTADSQRALLSSMQSFESALLMIGLKRLPNALVLCVTAAESAMKRYLGVSEHVGGFTKLLEMVQQRSKAVREFPHGRLFELAKRRNQITHDGFSPDDDSECALLIIEVALPFLTLCYRALYEFELWPSLFEEYGKQFEIASHALRRSKQIPDIDRSYCLNSLSQVVRWNLGEIFTARLSLEDWPREEFDWRHSDESDKVKAYFKRSYDADFFLDCPLCREGDSVVAEIDHDELENLRVVALPMICVNCGFTAGRDQPFLSELVLEDTLRAKQSEILKEYGLNKDN